MAERKIALIPGDGIGGEVVPEARKVLDALGLEHAWTELPWGSQHFRETGRMMPPGALETLREHDAALLGAVGEPGVPDHETLWGLVLPIRQGLDLWANLRPVRLLPGIAAGRRPCRSRGSTVTSVKRSCTGRPRRPRGARRVSSKRLPSGVDAIE
jgi:tartrate dehydrogenase/decarboxylase/D-malate dehydrogenase